MNAAAIAARRAELNEGLDKVSLPEDVVSKVPEEGNSIEVIKGELYCKECYIPLHPDPPAGKLFIFLHAFRYTTSHGPFETEIPWWADSDWSGDGWIQY